MREILHILIVEDNPADVDLIREGLSDKGNMIFQVESVLSLSDALARLKNQCIDLVLLDLGLPDSQGIETFYKLNEVTSQIPVIILTGNDDQSVAVLAVQKGAQDYLVKDEIGGGGNLLLIRAMRYAVERKQAENNLKEASERLRSLAANVDSMYLVNSDCTYLFMNEGHLKRLGISLEEVTGKIHGDFHSQEDTWRFAEHVSAVCETGKSITEEHRSERDGKYFLRTFSPIRGQSADRKISQVAVISKDITNLKLEEKKHRDTLDSLRKALNSTIHVIVSAVETRDPYTAGHQVRSANLARAIATEMGLPQEKVEGIRTAGSIHDVGKLSVPAEILSRPTKLPELEFSLVKEHASQGYEILKGVESPWPLAEIVYQHHERMDGSGYPRGLKGEEILTEARILAVADVVEAMSSHRPYRPALGIDAALEEVEKNKGILYDTDVVDACHRLFREKGFQFTNKMEI